MELTKDVFFETLDKAIAERKGIEVSLSHPNLFEKEVIRNSKHDVAEKKMYYEKAYNDALELARFPQIYITDITLVD